MRDVNGDELVDGWYWSILPEYPGMIFPIQYASFGMEFFIDGDWCHVNELEDIKLYKAIMPEF